MALLPWRRATAAQRAAASNVPDGGQLLVETDTGNVAGTDGITAWSALKRLVRIDEVTTAVQQAIASALINNSIIQSLAAESGWIDVKLDQTGKVVLGVRTTGRVFAKLDIGSVSSEMLAPGLLPPWSFIGLPPESGYGLAFTGADSRILGGFAPDGTFKLAKPGTNLVATKAASDVVELSGVTGQRAIWRNDSTLGDRRKIFPQGAATGNVVSHQLIGSDLLIDTEPVGGGTITGYWNPAASTQLLPKASDRTRILCLGESTTANGTGSLPYPKALAQALSGVLYSATGALDTTYGSGPAVYNVGYSGSTSMEVAARQGGVTVTVTLPSNKIPAGSAAAIAASSYTPGGALVAAGPYDPTVMYWRLSQAWTITGSIAGVHGTLVRASGASTLTFTPDTAPVADVAVPARTAFVSDQDTSHLNDVVLFFIGINDLGDYSHLARQITPASIAGVVAHMQAYTKRYLIFSVLNTGTQTPGTVGFDSVTKINAQLAATYGDRYLDIRSYICSQQIFTDSGTTATTADLAAIAASTPPPSMYAADLIHPNDIAKQAYTTYRIVPKLQALGWY